MILNRSGSILKVGHFVKPSYKDKCNEYWLKRGSLFFFSIVLHTATSFRKCKYCTVAVVCSYCGCASPLQNCGQHAMRGMNRTCGSAYKCHVWSTLKEENCICENHRLYTDVMHLSSVICYVKSA